MNTLFTYRDYFQVDLQVATTSPDSYNAVLDQYDTKCVVKDVSTSPAGQDLHLVIAADVLSNRNSSVLKNSAASLKPGGFLILEETGKADSAILKDSGLVYVAKQLTVGKSYVLLKKVDVAEGESPIVIKITEKNFAWVENVKAALVKSESEGQKVLLVGQGERVLGLVGLMTCIRQEAGGNNVRYVFIQDTKAEEFSLKSSLYASQLSKDLVANVLKGGQWGSYRHLRLDQQNDTSSLQVEHAYINTLVRGDLSSLRWIEGPLSYYQPEKFPDNEFCNVYYAPLNFR